MSRIVSFVSCLLIFTACALMKSEYSEEVKKDLPSNAESIPQEWKSAATTGDVSTSWLKTFNDPVLEKIVEESLKNNLDLKNAQAKLESSAASARLAGAAANPFVDASGTLQTIGTLDGKQINNRSAGLNVSWEFDVWGRLKSERQSAKFKYEADALDYEYARQSLAAATTKSWFLCIEMLQQTNLAKNNLSVAEKNLKITETRVKYGKSSRQNISLAKADVATRREKLQTLDNSLQQSKRALEVLLGRYPAAEIKVSAQFPKMIETVPAGLPSEILDRRPDVQAGELRLKSAFYKVKAKKLGRLPQLSLTGALGIPSPMLKNLLGGDSSYFNTGANFLFPVFDGGTRKEAVKIATAEQKSALASYGSTALTAFKEVENTLSNEQVLKEREISLQEAVNELEEAVRHRRLEEQSGKTDILSVLQLEAQLNQNKSTLITLKNLRVSERVNLFLSLGGTF